MFFDCVNTILAEYKIESRLQLLQLLLNCRVLSSANVEIKCQTLILKNIKNSEPEELPNSGADRAQLGGLTSSPRPVKSFHYRHLQMQLGDGRRGQIDHELNRKLMRSGAMMSMHE